MTGSFSWGLRLSFIIKMNEFTGRKPEVGILFWWGWVIYLVFCGQKSTSAQHKVLFIYQLPEPSQNFLPQLNFFQWWKKFAVVRREKIRVWTKTWTCNSKIYHHISVWKKKSTWKGMSEPNKQAQWYQKDVGLKKKKQKQKRCLQMLQPPSKCGIWNSWRWHTSEGSRNASFRPSNLWRHTSFLQAPLIWKAPRGVLLKPPRNPVYLFILFKTQKIGIVLRGSVEWMDGELMLLMVLQAGINT